MGKRLSTLVAILMLFIFPVQTFAIANESILNRISSDSTIAKNEKSDKKESKLGIPKNLKAELIGTTVFVKWNKESKATGYDIEIDGVVKDNKKSNTYIHKNLEPKSWHTYRVRARYSTEVSEWSNPVKKVVAAPVKPILEYVVLNSDGTCTAFWGWLNINSFSIDVPQADSMFTGTVTDETTIPPAVFSSGLQIDKFSTVFSGDTLVWTIKNPDGTTLKATANKSAARKPYISAPVSISADADFNSVTVTWNKVNWAAGYDIEVDGVIVNNSTDTKYVHKNITPGTAHKYRVRTRGIGTASYWSSVVDKTTLLDKPLNVIVKPNTTYITIGWDKVEGATSYDVEENGTVIYSGQDTEYTHADIIPGTMHSYTVKAKTAFAESEKSQPVTAITLLDTPSGLSTVCDETSITLAWNPVAGADGYEAEADGTAIDVGEATSYRFSGLNPGTQHVYRVRAKTAYARSEWSDIASQVTKLGVPSYFNVTPSGNEITLTWDGVAGAESYEIEVDGNVIENGTNTSYVHTGLLPGTTHTYRVKAKNSLIAGEWSGSTTVNTLFGIPQNVTASVTEDSILTQWNAVDGAVGYDIEVNGTITDNGTSTSYTISDVTPGYSYVYRVRARTAFIVGNWSVPVNAVIPVGVPQNVSCAATENTITVIWEAIKGAEGYDVEVDGSVIDAGNVTSYTHDGLIPGGNHVYRVRAKAGNALGEYSNAVAKATLLGIPSGITESVNGDSLTITWEPVTGATGYDIEINENLADNAEATTYTISGIVPGTQYVYRVRAKTQDVTGDWSDSVTNSTSLGTPSNISSVVNETGITIIWDAVSGATSYEIEVNGTVVELGDNTSYTDINPLPGTVYSFRVRAKTAVVSGEWSIMQTRVTQLGVPDNFRAFNTESTITLEWDTVPGATGYDVEIDDGAIVSVQAPSFTHESLEAGSEHTYRVRARNDSATGEWSVVIGTISKISKPSTPQNINTSPTDNTITVTWDKAEGASGYEVEADGVVIKCNESTSFVHNGLYADTQYTYRVRAVNGSGASGWSAPVVQRTNFAPVGIGKGLKAEYFNGWNLDTKKLTRIDSTVNFNWGTGTPDSSVKSEFFSARWTGYVQPRYTTTYKFYVFGDNGVRLWVNGQKIVDRWTNSFGEEVGTVDLVAGQKYEIRLEYFDYTGAASVKLMWSCDRLAKEIIPQSQLYCPTPDSPANILSLSSESEISITWDSVLGAEKYDIEINGAYVGEANNNNYLHTKLLPDTQYVYRVRAKNNSGAGEWSAPVTVRTLPAQGNGTGLKAEYFNGWNLDTKKLTRIDSAVNFNWGTGSPDTSVKSEFFSARWTGYVLAKYTGTYKFHAFADNGVRLWVNGQKIIDRWTDSFGEEVGIIDLVAGQKYEIRLEYFDYTGAASVKLMWSSDRQSKEVIPQSYLYLPVPETPSGISANGTETAITVTWGSVIEAEGYDIEVDGTVINNGTGTSYTHTGLQPDTQHVYRVRAKNSSGAGEWGSAVISNTVPKSSGLRGEYFNGWNFEEKKLTRIDNTIDFNWGTGSPDTSVKSEFFSARWTGYVKPKFTGTYKFHAFADNGVRLWVNGQKIIDRWTDSFGEEAGTIDLIAGQKYEIRLEYFDYTGAASVKLMWSSDKQSKEVIPQSQLTLPLPYAPSDISTLPSSNSINVVWKTVTGAEGYDIEVDGTVIDNGTGTSYAHTGLQPDTQYVYRVRAKNNSGAGEWSTPVTVNTLPAQGNGTGLKAEYFNGWNLDTKKLTRIDSAVNFNWGTGSPDTSVKSEFFSARWTGYVLAKYTGTYKFHAFADNGVRLWVNGQKIIDRWTDSFGEEVGTIDLVAGQKYEIRLEYFDYTGAASVKLMWSSDKQSKEVIPQSYLYLPVPETPSGISANGTETAITVTWGSVTEAEGYDIEVDGAVIDNGTGTSYTHTGLQPDTQYVYRVRAKNNSGAGEWSAPVTVRTLPAQGNGTGLKAEYFNGWNLDTKKLTRIDSAVNFNWGTGSPDTSVKSEFFSARWTGYVLAKYTGTYKFHAFADNGVRLWVNGQKIIDRWTDSFGEEVGTIDLVAGQKYEIRLEYFDYTGAASVKLMWSSDKQSKEVIPQSYLYLPVPETPSGISANGTETTITVTWGSVIEAEGYDIEVDGTVISNGTGTSYTHTGLQPDSQHTYRVRAKNSSGTGEWSSALAKRTLLAPVGNGNGLSAEYFNGWNLDTKILTRIDSSIDFNWGTGSPDTSVKNEFFSVRWTGYVEPRYTGTYKFHAFADNGVRLWVNGQKIIDRWTDSFGEEVGTIDLTAGQKYEIRLEYFDYTGAASMKLMWSCDRLAKEIIPQSQLYSPVPEIPLNLKFSNTDSLLTWDTVIGAEYYEIEVDGLVAGSTANTSFTLSDELSGTQHVYRVRAKNSSGTGEWSLVAVANT